MPFEKVGSYGPYEDWKEDKEYFENDIVFHKGHLYQLIVNGQFPADTSTGENPLTATFACKFADKSYFNSRAEEGEEPENAYEQERTMRRWILFTLPGGYYQAMLLGQKGKSAGDRSFVYMIQVRAFADELVYGDDRLPVTECSYTGYNLNNGLDATYSSSGLKIGGLLYSFTAVPEYRIDRRADTAYARIEFENERSLLWMPNTIATINPYGPSDNNDFEYENNGVTFESLHQLHSSMQTFGRSFTWGYLELDYPNPPIPRQRTGSSVAFTDNWYDTFPEPPDPLPVQGEGGYPNATSPDYLTT